MPLLSLLTYVGHIGSQLTVVDTFKRVLTVVVVLEPNSNEL